MARIHPINSTSEQINPTTESPAPSPSVSTESQISSARAPQMGKIEIFIKSTFALTLGFIPFIQSLLGKACMKFTACIAQSSERSLGWLIGKPIRFLCGIRATIFGICCFGGAFAFSITQQLIWGRELVFHPQEERVNTLLAKYGGGREVLNDFGYLLSGFFLFSDEHLLLMRNFEPS